MDNLVQIQVNIAELVKSEKKLSTLSKNITNRHIKVRFSNAKGEMADNLISIAEQLNSIWATLAGLISKTENAVANARVSFVETDNEVAQWFGVARD